MSTSKREQILTALAAFIRQRPGLEFGNYGDVRLYRQEMRSITRDRHIAEKLLAQVSWRESIGETELRDAFRAFSGRLSIIDRPDGSIGLEYCAGQYFPTEYRKAACAVLASALWDQMRGGMSESAWTGEGREGQSLGEIMRARFRKEFGRDIQSRYFN